MAQGRYAACEWCGEKFDTDNGITMGYEIALQKIDVFDGTIRTEDAMHDGYLCHGCAKKAAAGPELLQAARCALADLEGVMEAYDPNGYHPGWTTIQELRAAITKATAE